MVQRVLLVCLALVVSVSAATGDHENSVSIDQLSRQIRDVTSRDVQGNRQLIQVFINTGHHETAKVYKYIDEAIKQLADILIDSIRAIKNNTPGNFATVEENIKANLETMNTNMQTNNQLIVGHSVYQLRELQCPPLILWLGGDRDLDFSHREFLPVDTQLSAY